jgi:hypothetical protein
MLQSWRTQPTLQRERISRLLSEHGRSATRSAPPHPRILPLTMTDDEITHTADACEAFLSPDPSVGVPALRELTAVVTHHGCAASPLFDERHITRLVQLTSSAPYERDSLRILGRLHSNGDFAVVLLAAGVIPRLSAFLGGPNAEFLIAAVQILGNNSCLSVEFRDSAFSEGLFESLAAAETLAAKDRAWCLSTAFEAMPFPEGLVESVLPHLLALACTPRARCISRVTKVLQRLAQSGSRVYRDVVCDFRFLGVLVDVVHNGGTRHAERAMEVLADCCFDGDEVIGALLAHDIFAVVFARLDVSPVFMRHALALAENWLLSSEAHQLDVVGAFCRPVFEHFVTAGFFDVKVTAVRVLLKLAELADITDLTRVLTPQLAAELVAMLFVDEELAARFVFPIFRLVFERSAPDFALAFAAWVGEHMGEPEFESLLMSEDEEVALLAHTLRATLAARLGNA